MVIKLQNPQKLPCMFKVKVDTDGLKLIGIAVCGTSKPYTYYTFFKIKVKGSRVIDIRLPVCPKEGFIRIWNAGSKSPEGQEQGFKIAGIKKLPLPLDTNIADSKNKSVKNFVQLAKEFAQEATYLSTKTNDGDRSIYKSDDGKFTIHFVDEIVGKDGKPRKTSMRVNNKTGVMEVAKKYIVNYTVPERIAILLHEFSHFYVNKVHSDEFEADMNALMIYCGMGFPRQEGGTAFYKVFYRTPSDMNIERMKKIMKFLKDYDRTNFKVLN